MKHCPWQIPSYLGLLVNLSNVVINFFLSLCKKQSVSPSDVLRYRAEKSHSVKLSLEMPMPLCTSCPLVTGSPRTHVTTKCEQTVMGLHSMLFLHWNYNVVLWNSLSAGHAMSHKANAWYKAAGYKRERFSFFMTNPQEKSVYFRPIFLPPHMA